MHALKRFWDICLLIIPVSRTMLTARSQGLRPQVGSSTLN